MHDESLNKSKIKIINWVSFIMGFAQAALMYVLSSYFKEISGTENVGIFYFLAYGISLLILVNLHKLVKRWGKSNVFFFSLIFKIAALSFLMIMPPNWWALVFLIMYIIFSVIEWVSMDVLLESFSTDSMSGRIRGKHLTILNAGFLLGPFISTWIIDDFGFNGIFLFLFFLNAFNLVLSITNLNRVNHKFESDISSFAVIKKIAANKDLLNIYYISFVLEFFYALMIIYVPIYLLDLGLNWENIGFIFTIMLIPFVLVQYPMGYLADKKWGEKEFILASLVIMAISTAVVFFTATLDVFIWAIILFGTRIGAALIEVLRDSYFYKKIDGHDVDLINFFRTAMPLGYIVGAVASTLILFLFPVKYIFLIVALAVGSAIYCGVKLVDNASEKQMADLVRESSIGE